MNQFPNDFTALLKIAFYKETLKQKKKCKETFKTEKKVFKAYILYCTYDVQSLYCTVRSTSMSQ